MRVTLKLLSPNGVNEEDVGPFELPMVPNVDEIVRYNGVIYRVIKRDFTMEKVECTIHGRPHGTLSTKITLWLGT